MSLIGKELIDFKLDAFHNNQFIEVSNNDLKGKWSVLVFYPGDFTFVCPTELEELAHYYDEFKNVGCEVYSVSTDSHFVHKAWFDNSPAIGKVKYPMLSDPTGMLADSLNILVKESWEALRGSFVVNPRGEVVAMEVNDMGIGRSAKDLLRKVQAAQYVEANGGEACPANWNPGEDTLKPGIDLVGKI